MVIVAAIALPSVQVNGKVRVIAASNLFASDLEYAQSLSLSAPGDPALVRVAADGSGYWVARKSAPNTPILRPEANQLYQVVFGVGDARQLADVIITKLSPAATDVQFDEFGRLSTSEMGDYLLSAGGKSLRVKVSATTGATTVVY